MAIVRGYRGQLLGATTFHLLDVRWVSVGPESATMIAEVNSGRFESSGILRSYPSLVQLQFSFEHVV